MSSKFARCHEITAKWEGGWSDHSRDPGGKTNWGVTQATLTKHLGRPASTAEIRNLTKAKAEDIYKEMFWAPVSGEELPPGVDLCVYDFGVNSGPSRGVKSLQAAVGVKADGWVGEATLQAVEKLGRRELINTLCDRRLAFMEQCRGSDGKLLWPTFGKGWANRVADIRARALAMSAGIKPSDTQATLTPAPIGGTAKALPAPPVEQTVSTEQKIGGAAAVTGGAAVVLGPVAGFWRDNKDVLADPTFLVVAAVLAVVVVVLVLRKAKAVEVES